MKELKWLMSAALLSMANGNAWAGEEGAVSLGVGFERSSGKYGGTSTIESTSIPITLRYAQDDWSLKLTVPYLSVTGDGSVIINGIRGSGGYMGGSGGMRVPNSIGGIGQHVPRDDGRLRRLAAGRRPGRRRRRLRPRGRGMGAAGRGPRAVRDQ